MLGRFAFAAGLTLSLSLSLPAVAAEGREGQGWGDQEWGETRTDRTYLCLSREHAERLSRLSRNAFKEGAGPRKLGDTLLAAIAAENLRCRYGELTYYPVSYPTIIEGGMTWVSTTSKVESSPCGEVWCPSETRFVKSILIFEDKAYPIPAYVSTPRRIVTSRGGED